jgi:streptogramin lyase
MQCLPRITKIVGNVMALVGVLAATLSTHATAQVSARFTEWQIPLTTIGTGIRVDRTPVGNLAGSTGTVWETTGGANPHLIKFVPGMPLESALATWTAWSLNPAVENAAGLDISADGHVFVNTHVDIQRINPATNARTRWAIESNWASDLSRGRDGSVWTALANRHIQRLVPDGTPAATATATRWNAGGSGEILLAGVKAHPQSGLVYFTDNALDSISELNPATNQVRSWSTLSAGASRPRQLSIDAAGDVWVVTASHHILRLRPETNELFGYLIPTSNANPYGVVADGLIGFTEKDTAKVGMLAPIGAAVVVLPTASFVTPSTITLVGIVDTVLPTTGTVNPLTTDVLAMVTSTDETGVFTEASAPGSIAHAGIDRDVSSLASSFYYASTHSLLGHVTFGIGTMGFITGGGSIDVGGGRASFGFSVLRRVPGEPVRGHLHYKNHVTGEIVESETITDIFVAGATASFTGTMIKNGVSTAFRVDVTDNGEPGANDRFALSHSGTSVGNPLSSGNIKIHRDKNASQ